MKILLKWQSLLQNIIMFKPKIIGMPWVFQTLYFQKIYYKQKDKGWENRV